MVKNTSNSSGTFLLGNTSALNSEELKNFINLSEEINEHRRMSDQHSATNQPPRAQLKRQEIFECSMIDDDKFLSALENQNSLLGTTQITDLDVTQSIEDMLKYFDEDVNFRSSNNSTPTLQQISNRVASVVAKLKPTTNKLTWSPLKKSAKKDKSIKYPSVKALKAKYEPAEIQPNKVEDSKKPTKKATVKNVKQMAQMFNSKISQILNGGTEPTTYAQLENELSPEPKLVPKPREKSCPNLPIYGNIKSSPISSPTVRRKVLETKSQGPLVPPKPSHRNRANLPIYRDNLPSPSMRRKMQTKDVKDAACLVTEDVFRQLSVKDKALLYQKFIEDMSLQSTEFKQNAQQLQEHVRNKFIDGGVVVEKQQNVKQLARQIEAKMGVPKQTFSDSAIQYKTLPNNKRSSVPLAPSARKAKEAEDAPPTNEDFSHVSELKVYLKGPTEASSPQFITRVTLGDEAKNCKEEVSFKRSNNMIRHTYSTEAYAPPKKIRRTRDERLTPHKVFQNTHIEGMFYLWLQEKNGVSFDIKSRFQTTKDESPAPKQTNDSTHISNNTLETVLDWSNNHKEEIPAKLNESTSLERLNKELPPLESPMLLRSLDKPVEELKQQLNKTKRQAPPIPNSATKQRSSSESSCGGKPSEVEESESSAASKPKLTTDDSQPEQQTSTKLDDFEFVKPTKPPRRKKMRRTLTWKKENCIVESATVASTTTDSDSDCRAAAEAKKKNTAAAVQKAMRKCNNQLKKFIFSSTTNLKEPSAETSSVCKEQSINELNKSLLRVLNSPRKIKSAYTLTVLTSPSPYTESEQGENESLRTYRETSRSLPSIVSAMESDHLKHAASKSASMEIAQNQQGEMDKKSIIDSYTDQGFETGSNEMENSMHRRPVRREKSKSPLFFKLPTTLKKLQHQLQPRDSSDSACDSPSNCSTPFKDYGPESITMNVQTDHLSPIPQGPPKPRRRIFTEAESRRSSLAMQVIREDQPLDITETYGRYSEAAHIAKLPIDKQEMSSGKTSKFWISAGDFTTSMPIYYNSPDRVRLLFDIFCQKSHDSRDWHFGIDDHNFNKPDYLECISKRSKNTSHYWFSTGDLAVPFSGKYLHPDKIRRLFKFIRESLKESKDARLRFGVDDFEFSTTADNQSVSAKFSLESSYSQCLQLQSNDGQLYDDRRKYSWPNNGNVMRTSDLDQSELDVEASDSSRMSSTPMGYSSTGYNSPVYSGRESETGSPFRFSFGNESLDKLFENKCKIQPETTSSQPNTRVEKMLQRLHEQEVQLKSLEENVPEYMKRLRGVVKTIEKIGRENGFQACSVQQLENCMHMLSRYADICMDSCNEQLGKVLEAVIELKH